MSWSKARRVCRRRRGTRPLTIGVAIVGSLFLTFNLVTHFTEYIVIENRDLYGVGDFVCHNSEIEGICAFSVFNKMPLLAGLWLCNVRFVMTCKGFVYNTGTNLITLKSSLKGQPRFSPGLLLYVRGNFYYQGNGFAVDAECAPELNNKENPLVSNTLEQSSLLTCHLPVLDPFDPSIMKLIMEKKRIECAGTRLTEFTNGRLRIKDDNSQVKVLKVNYVAIHRKDNDDFSFTFSKMGQLNSNIPERRLDEDFVKVEVHTDDGNIQNDFHMSVSPKEVILNRSTKRPGIPLNVLMIGFHSTSHSHFIRKLPKVHNWLKADPGSFIFDGFGIVGDGLTPSLSALLVGKPEVELPEARKSRYENSACVDRWPFIFQLFKEHGYATMFSEDAPYTAAFNYRLRGFCEQPTDHYTRPFFLALNSAKSTFPFFGRTNKEFHCIGTRPMFIQRTHYLKSFYKAYPNTLKFSLTFSNVGQSDINDISSVEDPLYEFLIFVKSTRLLNNTMLIIFGDHGTRTGPVRSTLTGKLEERMPFLAITMPPWFKEKYPSYVNNLQTNTRRLSSPFDLHATFKHLVSSPVSPQVQNGQSLFEELSSWRTCDEAGIPEHFCPCQDVIQANTNHRHVSLTAQAAVSYINTLTDREGLAANCKWLELKSVQSAVLFRTNKATETFMRSADADGRIVQTGKMLKGSCLYRVQFQVFPGDAVYHVTSHVLNMEAYVMPNVVRTTKYGEESSCVPDSRRTMRDFCVCVNRPNIIKRKSRKTKRVK